MSAARPDRTVQLAFGAAMIMLLVVGALSYRSTIASHASDRWVQHTQEVLARLQDLSFSMEAISSSVRRFVITGEDIDLDAYRAADVNIRRLMPIIGNLTKDNPLQQSRLPLLQQLSSSRIERGKSIIALRNESGIDAAMESVRTGPTRQVSAAYQDALDQFRGEELRLLALRTADARRHSLWSNIVLGLGTGLGLLITAGAGWRVLRDNAERHRAEEALFAEKERAEVTLASIGDAVACTDISGNLTYLNAVAERMSGWSWQEAAGRPMGEVLKIIEGSGRETIADPMEMAVRLNHNAHLPANCILIRRDGQDIPIEDSVAPIHDRDGNPTGAVMVFRDVTASRAMALQIAHSAEHDFLTGLPNRMLLNDRIKQAIALAPRHMNHVAVLFLDLDGFKHINDSLGHPMGDKLLQSVANRLIGCVRSSDTVSRQGGDEFVVLLPEVKQLETITQTAKRMLVAVSKSHSIDDQHDLHVTTSIGISIYPDDGQDAEALIKNADTAMYRAKESGRKSYCFFKPVMNVQAVERQSMQEGLRRALERNEFSVDYQPKFNLTTGLVTGAEALIRWNHPTRGAVPPAQFIPVAEDCGLIQQIGAWILREACSQAKAWLDAGLPPTMMAVNVSAMEFEDPNFLEGVFDVLAKTGLDPRSLELELTESVLMKRADVAVAILQMLRKRGIRVTVDDFGTGYSSLSYLRKFPVDALKIDQSFVRQISTAGDNTAIVAAVIEMARGLHLKVIAEGVETKEEVAFLAAHHCDEGQGHYFSRALPPDQFAALLAVSVRSGAA
ncbi:MULTISPECIES: EAL domain-containing protein [Rhodomicrobium]|uniref:putative bifunctional diguanylate cyclase/phosphodiesterase n=1 Tax=Rhodomicrobium TaxID=1068 RepID=UPI000B4B7340|nr:MULTISPECIES: EAL domain-containing protein [Rhodomicrobium]